MVRTMLVIVGAVVLVVLLVPRPNVVPVVSVDVASVAADAASALDFAPAVPVGLPGDWTATSARVQDGTGGVRAWHVGYLTVDGHYAAVEQAANAPRAWENTQVTDGAAAGTITVDGRQWIDRSRRDRGITSYVLRRPGLTTVVTGRAPLEQLETLMRSLPLQP